MGIYDPNNWNGCGVRENKLTFGLTANEKQLSVSGVRLYCGYHSEFYHCIVLSLAVGVR